MRARILLFLALLGAAGVLGAGRAAAQSCWQQHDGVESVYTIICEGEQPPQPGPPPPNPPPCPVTTEVLGPFRDENRTVCFVIVRTVDCHGNVLHTETREVPCSSPNVRNPCVDENGQPIFSIGPDGITCGRAGRRWRVEARVGYPPAVLDLRPYPATLVGWPTALRFSEAGTAEGQGRLDYVPLGGGRPEDPRPGDWRNVRLTLRLVPLGLCQAHLPHARGPMRVLRRPASPLPPYETLWLSLSGPWGRPTYVYYEVPSHPAAGRTFLDPGLNARVRLPGDFPAFQGFARAAYALHWAFEWEEFVEIKEWQCVPYSGPGQPNCRVGNSRKNNGIWVEVVKERRWEPRNEGGVVEPEAIQGLPERFRADLDGDGRADALWNYRVVLRRMDEADQPAAGPLAFQIELGGLLPFWVREAQGQIAWPGR